MIVPGSLLHGPTEALAAAWNKGVAEAFDQITFMRSFFFQGLG